MAENATIRTLGHATLAFSLLLRCALGAVLSTILGIDGDVLRFALPLAVRTHVLPIEILWHALGAVFLSVWSAHDVARIAENAAVRTRGNAS